MSPINLCNELKKTFNLKYLPQYDSEEVCSLNGQHSRQSKIAGVSNLFKLQTESLANWMKDPLGGARTDDEESRIYDHNKQLATLCRRATLILHKPTDLRHLFHAHFLYYYLCNPKFCSQSTSSILIGRVYRTMRDLIKLYNQRPHQYNKILANFPIDYINSNLEAVALYYRGAKRVAV